MIHEMIPWRKTRDNVSVRGGNQDFPLTALQRRMNRMFDDFFGDFGDLTTSPLGAFTHGRGAFVPRMDVTETDTGVTVTVELAGMDETDVEVTMADDVLTIKGEKKSKEKKDRSHYLGERYYGSFQRTFQLPTGVQVKTVEASFKRGVLKVVIPKSSETISKKIEIQN